MSKIPQRTLTAAGLALVFAASAASAQETVRIRGVIESVDGSAYLVKNRDGAELKLTVTDPQLYVAIVKATMADIKPGMFVGATGQTEETEARRQRTGGTRGRLTGRSRLPPARDRPDSNYFPRCLSKKPAISSNTSLVSGAVSSRMKWACAIPS